MGNQLVVLATAIAVASLAAQAAIDCGTSLQVMWDDTIVDVSRTTAEKVLHKPEFRDVALVCDRPWEGDGCELMTVFADVDEKGPVCRMYYLGWDMSRDVFGKAPDDRYCVCYAESRDGVAWHKPDLGIYCYRGETNNNIILGHGMFTNLWDCGMTVFKDTNPICPPAERYKGLCSRREGLDCFVSADGIHFAYGWPLLRKKPGREVMFDTVNNAFWNVARGRYELYVRGFTDAEPRAPFVDREIRHVLHASSQDFKEWSDIQPLAYDSPENVTEDYPMYTNGIFPYFRNPALLVGFPTRYNERGYWDENYDALPDAEQRKRRCSVQRRYGLAVTDGLFMVSRDGERFYRYDEAFLRPGPERARGWTYGSCYPAIGVIRTPHPQGAADELSIYVPHGHWLGRPTQFERYAIRQDGFVSRHAGYRRKSVLTKPLQFDGDEMHVNFSTSARGGMRVIVRESTTMEPLASIWMFGDQVDRKVAFLNGEIRKYSRLGNPLREVTVEFQLEDADIYSFWFVKCKASSKNNFYTFPLSAERTSVLQNHGKHGKEMVLFP